MQVTEPIFDTWKARLGLAFELRNGKTVLAEKRFEGPLAVQKPFYPEGEDLCHAIVVHPPAGMAGGDDLEISLRIDEGARALLTTPGATKWYRSRGAPARQRLSFDVDGDLEWLPQESIFFDGTIAEMESSVRLGASARYVGWEILCFGRTGSGETLETGSLSLRTTIEREGKPLWRERGEIEAAARLARSAAGLAGKTVCATLVAAAPEIGAGTLSACRAVEGVASTLLPGVLVARCLVDSGEEARRGLVRIWKAVRPSIFGRDAIEPRIWST
ncbi:MAG: urease accessory protein UreD [Betaproteobacteria bacterium]|nr:urease accessory protein UreD [Betaproteobacteria bacterium]